LNCPGRRPRALGPSPRAPGLPNRNTRAGRPTRRPRLPTPARVARGPSTPPGTNGPPSAAGSDGAAQRQGERPLGRQCRTHPAGAPRAPPRGQGCRRPRGHHLGERARDPSEGCALALALALARGARARASRARGGAPPGVGLAAAPAPKVDRLGRRQKPARHAPWRCPRVRPPPPPPASRPHPSTNRTRTNTPQYKPDADQHPSPVRSADAWLPAPGADAAAGGFPAQWGWRSPAPEDADADHHR